MESLFKSNPLEYAYNLINEERTSESNLLAACLKWMSYDQIRDMLQENELGPFGKTLDPILVVSDRNGVYIPQLYCNRIDEKIAEEMHIPFEDVQICQSGPDHEWYWESWQIIRDSAEWVSDGVKWSLYQDGDLWEIPEGFSFEGES